MTEQVGGADTARYDEVLADPRYQRLLKRRGRFTWALSIGGGVTSLGIPVGIGIILFAILLTGLYVRRANKEYDLLVDALRRGDEA